MAPPAPPKVSIAALRYAQYIVYEYRYIGVSIELNKERDIRQKIRNHLDMHIFRCLLNLVVEPVRK